MISDDERNRKDTESLALLRLLEMSAADVEAGRVWDSDEVFADIRRMIAEKREEQK